MMLQLLVCPHLICLLRVGLILVHILPNLLALLLVLFLLERLVLVCLIHARLLRIFALPHSCTRPAPFMWMIVAPRQWMLHPTPHILSRHCPLSG